MTRMLAAMMWLVKLPLFIVASILIWLVLLIGEAEINNRK